MTVALAPRHRFRPGECQPRRGRDARTGSGADRASPTGTSPRLRANCSVRVTASNPSFDAELRSLVRRLSRLPESAMRAAVLCEHLSRSSAEGAAHILDALVGAGRSGGAPFHMALQAAVDMLQSGRLDYARQQSIYDAAHAAGLERCRELFYSSEAASETDPLDDAPRALTPGTRPLTLGERKSMARHNSRNTLEKLLVDPSVRVIAPLLDNPLITIDDVLQIATSRRTQAVVLAVVARHRRWKIRTRVRVALLRHPAFPRADALRLIGFLNTTDLRQMACDGCLSAPIREAMRARLRRHARASERRDAPSPSGLQGLDSADAPRPPNGRPAC